MPQPDDFPTAEFEDTLEKAKERKSEKESENKEIPKQIKILKSNLNDYANKVKTVSVNKFTRLGVIFQNKILNPFTFLQIQTIDKEVAKNRKAINAICAQARNDFAKAQLKKDFKAGLRVGSNLSSRRTFKSLLKVEIP